MTQVSKPFAIRKKIDISEADRHTVFTRQLEVNGEFVSMTDFLFDNLCAEGVDHIPMRDAKEVVALNVGDTMYIGTSTITRTK